MVPFTNVMRPSQGYAAYRCPCCRFTTLAERGGYEVCPVCSWEDDGQDDHDADEVRGGPNSDVSLTQARENFRLLGAFIADAVPHVRPATDDERKPPLP